MKDVRKAKGVNPTFSRQLLQHSATKIIFTKSCFQGSYTDIFENYFAIVYQQFELYISSLISDCSCYCCCKKGQITP